MTKEEKRKELRERLEPEIRWTYAYHPHRVGATVVTGQLGSSPVARLGYMDRDSQGERIVLEQIKRTIMNWVFEKEGCSL